MRPLARPLVLVALALLAACGGKDTSQDSANPLATGWNPVSGMLCADESATGIGFQPGTTNRVLVFLSGGGACWDAASCSGNPPRSFGSADYTNFSGFLTLFAGLPGNPFAGWNLVFVPYCTGDVHAGGDVTKDYGTGATWRHHGRANLDAALARVAAAMPMPEKVAISGSSAGGFGSLLALDLAHGKWAASSATKFYLVDDSGQTLVGGDLPQALRDAWWSSWSLSATITPLCSGCPADLSQLWDVLHAKYVSDRMALLTTTEDGVMSLFFGLDPVTQFHPAVLNFKTKLAGVGNAKSFISSGSGHALLTNPTAYSAGGIPLLTWLGYEVTDSASWASEGPP